MLGYQMVAKTLQQLSSEVFSIVVTIFLNHSLKDVARKILLTDLNFLTFSSADTICHKYFFFHGTVQEKICW